MKYEAVRGPRFAVDHDAAGELVRIRARRSALFLPFLIVWITGWTVAGVGALHEFVVAHEPFLAVWLCFWVFGEGFAALMIAWMLAGAETLRVIQGDLEQAWRIGPWTWRKLYEGARVRDLKAASQNPVFSTFGVSAPFGIYGQFGAVQFTYGARTVRAASGLDEAEGKLIAERLLKSLPTAT